MRHRRPRIVASAGAVALAATLGLTACAADSAPETAPAPEVEATADAEPELEAAESPADGDRAALIEYARYHFGDTAFYIGEQGPLSAIWAEVNADALRGMDPNLSREERDRIFDEMLQATQVYTAACMRHHGFDFEINPDPESGRQRMVRPDLEYPSLDWTLEFGLGITNPGFYSVMYGSDEDPNDEMVEAMSPAEREAWDRALWGDWSAPDSDDPMDRGCHHYGSLRGFGWDTAVTEHPFTALENEVNNFWSRFGNTHDTGGDQFEQEWANCMVDAGHPRFANQTNMRHTLEEEWTALTAASFDWASWDWNQGSPSAEDMVLDEEIVAPFRAREFDLALYGFICEHRVNVRPRQAAYLREREAEFVEANRDELEAWLMYVRAQRAGGGV